jgi:hypothetical protein
LKTHRFRLLSLDKRKNLSYSLATDNGTPPGVLKGPRGELPPLERARLTDPDAARQVTVENNGSADGVAVSAAAEHRG